MNLTRLTPAAVVFAAITLSGAPHVPAANDDAPPVTPPPDSFFEMVRPQDREPARQFYRKYIDVNGMPVVAAAEVADAALQRTHTIVTHMLAGRPDILETMVKDRMYLIIIGKDQVYTDMPEYRNHPNPAYQNERVRGTGGRPTSFGEENLLSLPLDRYDDESIGVHEFCHTIDGALRSMDPAWRERLNSVYRRAMSKGLWTKAYAASNQGEYWAEICQSYFDCNRVDNWNHGSAGTRQQLKDYDPEGFQLVSDIFKLSPEQDWRYSWVQNLPNVTAPPARFKIDPWYTEFTWAREFTVVGRQASDEALLKANHTIRRMFAYRHDVLKALINHGVKLVVLGKDENLSDLPEFKLLTNRDGLDPSARYLDYRPDLKLLVVDGETIRDGGESHNKGGSQVIRVFAKAVHTVTGTRPVDPGWESRGRDVQQYELRVKRLDVRFDEKLKELHARAAGAGKGTGTAAARDHVEYWVAGVLAYFDASGEAALPGNGGRPVNTREALNDYDPELYALVHETMAFEGRADWRYK